jgi:hypothetical protein
LICFTSSATFVLVTSQYKFFNKNSRKRLSKTQFKQRRFTTLRNSNTPLMFVRAPKHFKSGKQRVVFFNGIFRRQTKFLTSLGFCLVNSNSERLLYSLAHTIGRTNTKPDVFLSRSEFSTTLRCKIFF